MVAIHLNLLHQVDILLVGINHPLKEPNKLLQELVMITTTSSNSPQVHLLKTPATVMVSSQLFTAPKDHMVMLLTLSQLLGSSKLMDKTTMLVVMVLKHLRVDMLS